MILGLIVLFFIAIGLLVLSCLLINGRFSKIEYQLELKNIPITII